MNFENLTIWCWIIPALIGIISGIIGYYWGRGNQETTIDNSAEMDSLKKEIKHLEAELTLCKKQKIAPPPVPVKNSTAAVTALAFDAGAAKAAFGKKIKQDDLKVVEGIGPKIEQLFHSFDIKTWKALSEASVAKCQEVLNSGGERYKIHNPGSWPLQSKMAYEGKWKALSKWQDEHKGGKL